MDVVIMQVFSRFRASSAAPSFAAVANYIFIFNFSLFIFFSFHRESWLIVGTRGREEKRIKLIGIVVEIVGFARFNTRDEKKPALPTAGAFVLFS